MIAKDIIIRNVAEDELTCVADLTVAAYAADAGFSDVDDYIETLRDVPGRVRDAEVFVAQVKGRLLGGITFVAESASPLAEWDDAGAAGIRMLAIAPEAQGMGLGRALTNFCVTRARALGKGSMVLHSADYMLPAHALYQSIGFERYAEIDFVVEDVVLWGYRLVL